MSSESRKDFEEHRVTETSDALTQDDATIKELSPKDDDANAVRGGLEPTNGKPAVFITPPET